MLDVTEPFPAICSSSQYSHDNSAVCWPPCHGSHLSWSTKGFTWFSGYFWFLYCEIAITERSAPEILGCLYSSYFHWIKMPLVGLDKVLNQAGRVCHYLHCRSLLRFGNVNYFRTLLQPTNLNLDLLLEPRNVWVHWRRCWWCHLGKWGHYIISLKGTISLNSEISSWRQWKLTSSCLSWDSLSQINFLV